MVRRRGAPVLLIPVLVLAMALTGGRVSGQDAADLSEYQVKAAYLYYFSTFVEWPAEDSDLVIGILGQDPFGETLDETLRGKAVNNRRLVVRRFRTLNEARASQILFVSASENARVGSILEALEGSHILTVGDAESFAVRGGAIAFRMEDNKVRFDINAAALERARLKISAQLMKLGRPVHESQRTGG